jgi:GH24 family phage-related lysozyme (muramidase)
MLNAGDLKGASEQFYLWVNVIKDGKPAIENGLVKRRAAEKALFLKP